MKHTTLIHVVIVAVAVTEDVIVFVVVKCSVVMVVGTVVGLVNSTSVLFSVIVIVCPEI